MKDFFMYVLATIAGIVITMLLLAFFGFISIVGMISSSQATKSVKDNSVLVIKLKGAIAEQAEPSSPLDDVIGSDIAVTGLDDLLGAIHKAKTDDHVKGIYLEGGVLASDSYASLQAIHKALTDFRKTGKFIIAYADAYSQGTYYLASAADKVYLNPEGRVVWQGLVSEPVMYKDLLKKLGINMQLAKVGAYKSLPERYTADKMSDANRAQVTAYLNGIWGNVLDAVAQSRKISKDSLNAYADRNLTFEAAESYKRLKLVDGLVYAEQMKGIVKERLGLDEDDEIPQLSVADMQNVKATDNDGDDEIAVYYAYGEIVNSISKMASASHHIASDEVCRDLAELMDDDDVKAVVIRVNSGGGDAFASEQIWHQVELLKKKKPVVVSMGGMAASGAYYISAGANWIVAEPTTLTGSIGIFGLFPDASELLTQKLGIKFDQVKTNKHSDFGTLSRPFSPDEMAMLEGYVDRGYQLFRSRVATGRHMSVGQVEKIAQGHVWLGQDALKIRLVDELGGLDEAVAKAAKLAKTNDYYTQSYPAKADWMDQLLDKASGTGSNLDEQLQITLGQYYKPFMLMKYVNELAPVQARIPFEPNIK